MSSNLLHLRATSLNHLQRFFCKHKLARETAKKTTAWKLLLVALVLLSATATKTQAAFPLSDTLGPTATAPSTWIGTATGPANLSPAQTCREGLDCDTFILTFSGTTADWAGKTALIKINWQLLATDYDLYILRELPSGQFVIAQSTNHPANSHATQELIDFSPAFYGTGRYLVRVMYTAATSQDQYEGSATVAVSESSCRVPGLTVLSDLTGDTLDAQANHDIESVSVAEPYLVGTSKLVFTIKATDLSQLTPNTSWRVYFRTPTVAGPRYFVDMRTDANGAVSYKYGTGTDTMIGDVDEGRYNAQTGLITIVVAHNKVGFPRPNQSPAEKLEQIYALVLVGSVPADSAPTEVAELSQASYTVVGNSMCNPGKIAFISNIDGNNEVYVMHGDGSNPVNMTNDSATEYSPSWSPDGSKLTFASSRAGGHDIFVMNSDGSNLTNLTNMPGSDLDPAWSPDGKLIAFDGWRDTDLNPGTPKIYVMNASGTNQVRLTHDTASYRGPSWSPDGKKLAFWGGPGASEIFVMDADGTDMTQLTSGAGTSTITENIHSAWSPDGTRIAFSSKRGFNHNIYVMNADGSDIRRLTTAAGNNYSPSWSPDGLCIAFSSDRDGDFEIYAMNADGSNQTKLTSTSAGFTETAPAWQPNFPPTLPTPAPPAVLTKTSDFDGDGKDDLAFWRASNSSWNIINSSNSSIRTQSWGEAGDVPVPGDYDGDGKTDLGVFKPTSGAWIILKSQTNAVMIMPGGQKGDVPAPGDYDGDGKTDVAFFRTSETNWYILQSSNGANRVQQWGSSFDRLVPGDYDGDGKTDIAVFRPNQGKWYILKSSTGGSQVQLWGLRTDLTVPADYDGDGKTDLAIYRPIENNFYIIRSSTGVGSYQRWGDGGEAVVPADYDGDGKADLAVWRPVSGEWRILNSLSGTTRIQQWGQYGDVPIQHHGLATY